MSILNFPDRKAEVAETRARISEFVALARRCNRLAVAHKKLPRWAQEALPSIEELMGGEVPAGITLTEIRDAMMIQAHYLKKQL